MTAAPAPDDEALAARIIDLYERRAAQWAADRGDTLIERKWLDRFTSGMAPNACLLDLGCGSGAPIAVALARSGFRITGVDSSPTMANMFASNLPAHEIIVADMRRISLRRRFDGVLAWDSFFHLTHEDQRAMFGAFRAHAAQGAMLMFTSGPEHGVAIGSYRDEALYHASLALQEYRALLKAHGFEVIAHTANDPECGGHTIWLAQFADSAS